MHSSGTDLVIGRYVSYFQGSLGTDSWIKKIHVILTWEVPEIVIVHL